jgi:hypothetical protein
MYPKDDKLFTLVINPDFSCKIKYKRRGKRLKDAVSMRRNHRSSSKRKPFERSNY